MTIYNFLTLVGGLAMFLFGMDVMGKSLEKMGGSKLGAILEKMTDSRIKGVLLGLFVTAVIQSSGAVTVMAVGFVNSGIMALRQVIGIIMGANIGTTVTAAPGYPELAVKNLAELTGIDFKNSEDLIAATSDCGAYMTLSSAIKGLAVKMTKVCNDIRLLASGPRCGLKEINLPQLQPGSSIMPGKVNPVAAEVANQASFLAIGLDTTVMLAASAGQLELNVMEPVITFALYTQMKVMTNACDTLRTKLVEGVTANTERCKDYVMNSIGIVTLLKPHFGYQKCAAIAKEGYTTGKSLHQIVVDEQHLMTQAEWDATFNTQNLIHPKFVK